MNTILVVDDSLDIQASLKFFIEDEGHHYHGVLTPESACEYVAENTVDLVLLDMNFNQNTTSGEEGLATIDKLLKLDAHLPIVVMTGWATMTLAIDALRRGASDFIEKPWQDERLSHAISNLLEKRRDKQDLARLSEENKRLTPQPSLSEHAHSIEKKSVLDKLAHLAKSDMNILLTGENGTGKSFYARYLHDLSTRSDHSFIALNMGAFNDELFNSEIFGHKKGAFTDAKTDRIGAFTLAKNGTLFLDEIANLSLSSQAKLLHVLEERKYTALGSDKVLKSDARIISATNANLSQAINNNMFRQDLYYRLNTIEVEIPPLRKCKEDILPLAKQFLNSYCQQYDRAPLTLSKCAEDALKQYVFPGNIRELKHMMERVVFLASGDLVRADNLMISGAAKERENPTSQAVQTIDMTSTLDEVIEQTLTDRLAFFDGNASKAAKSLGMSRSAWYRKMAKYDAL